MLEKDLKKGLPLGTKAPPLNIKDIKGDIVNLNDALKKYDGILIEFFRGAW